MDLAPADGIIVLAGDVIPDPAVFLQPAAPPTEVRVGLCSTIPDYIAVRGLIVDFGLSVRTGSRGVYIEQLAAPEEREKQRDREIEKPQPQYNIVPTCYEPGFCLPLRLRR